MSKAYKICPVCGRKFHVCWTCENSPATSWKKVCDTFEHYSAYVTVVLWSRGEICNEEAIDRLKPYNHSEYMHPFKDQVAEIM